MIVNLTENLKDDRPSIVVNSPENRFPHVWLLVKGKYVEMDYFNQEGDREISLIKPMMLPGRQVDIKNNCASRFIFTRNKRTAPSLPVMDLPISIKHAWR